MKFKRPEAGAIVDKGFPITLKKEIPVPWVSVSSGDVTLYLSKERLEALAKHSSKKWTNKRWLSEEDRIRFINGVRAKKLLEISDEVPDGSGCAHIAENPVNRELQYILVSEIESGQVAAVTISSGSPLSRIYIHYTGVKADEMLGFGHIAISEEKSRPPFLLVQWWQA